MLLEATPGTLFEESKKVFTTIKFAGLSAKQVEAIDAFVKSNDNSIVLTGALFEFGPGHGGNTHKVIEVVRAASNGGPFVVELKAVRLMPAYRTLSDDSKEYDRHAVIPVGIFIDRLYKAIGWS